MKEKEFEIGDRVLITKSSENWGGGMDKYIDKVATLVSGNEDDHFKIDLDNGYWTWSNKQGHFVHFDMDKYRLQEARKLYPAGTMYNCANYAAHEEFIVDNPELFSIPELNVIYGELGKGAIYYKGKWAEILEKPSYLVKLGDEIQFNVRDHDETYDVYSYKVCHGFLSSIDSGLGNNSRIFNALGMDKAAKVKFCNDAYGYPSDGGDFPTCKVDDYEALTNVVKHLYDACNRFNVYGKV